jgi:hypothetical protein
VSVKSTLQAIRAKIPVGPILTWAWVLLNLTIAVYIFGESPLAGTLAFLSALVMFPPLVTFLQRRIKLAGAVSLRGAIAAMLFAFTYISLESHDNRPNDTEPANNPSHLHTLLDVVGAGDDDTDSFTSRPQNWQLGYIYQCWNFGRPGHFRIDIRRPDGSPTSLQGVAERARAGNGSFVYTPGGAYRLHIISNCHWRIMATG